MLEIFMKESRMNYANESITDDFVSHCLLKQSGSLTSGFNKKTAHRTFLSYNAIIV